MRPQRSPRHGPVWERLSRERQLAYAEALPMTGLRGVLREEIVRGRVVVWRLGLGHTVLND